uniref:Growth arrest specific 2 like 2 n=1 Tax=Lepisosteus oculatus TaxID=7918 RepID=W5M0S9_LEPOC
KRQRMSGIHTATNRSIKPFKSSEEYLYAMKEDLAEWLTDLYGISIAVDGFLEVLETGSLLCQHANQVTRVAGEFLRQYGAGALKMRLPTSGVTFVSSAQAATFLARDNVSNFISWCRKEMDIKDFILLGRNVSIILRRTKWPIILCLKTVLTEPKTCSFANKIYFCFEWYSLGFEKQNLCFHPLIPESAAVLQVFKPRVTVSAGFVKSCLKQTEDSVKFLLVQYLVSRCTCPSQFSMLKVSEGKYKVGDSGTLIFVRILRNHVMVRVGGGWDTLEHYLDKHDPCRCTS